MLQAYLPSLLEGARLTLALAAASLALALLLGLAGATAKLSGSPLWGRAAGVYTTLIRGVPELVLMLLVYFGGQVAVNSLARSAGYDGDVDIDPFAAGVLTLGFIYGAYFTETFRGAILAIPRGQMEAGMAFGMSPRQVFVRITAPQMVRLAIPSFTNNWLVLVKSTALVSVIGLNDMMQKAGQAAGATREPFTFYLAVGLLYLAITTVSVVALRLLEQRFSRGVKAVAL
jgi:arginine/ornithine transport system permease protein